MFLILSGYYIGWEHYEKYKKINVTSNIMKGLEMEELI